jgi:endoribonuclease Dicer
VIREYTDLDATECYGASGVAEWTAEQWKEQVGSKEVTAFFFFILRLRRA